MWGSQSDERHLGAMEQIAIQLIEYGLLGEKEIFPKRHHWRVHSGSLLVINWGPRPAVQV